MKGKVAIVFGGNGDIGGAIALGLCREGATVIPTGRNMTRLKKIIHELSQCGNEWSESRACDITKKASIDRLVNAVTKKYGRIDAMVCASGAYLNKPAEKLSLRDWNTIIDTNLTGVFTACQAVGKVMLAQNDGSIINIGSLSSFVALSNTTPYSVSKAGIVALTKALSAEWAKRGVRVNTIIPGVFPTRLNRKALSMKGRKKNILRGIPMKRLGRVDELVDAAIYLASEQSNYVTGISLPVDGGFLSFSGY